MTFICDDCGQDIELCSYYFYVDMPVNTQMYVIKRLCKHCSVFEILEGKDVGKIKNIIL